MKRKKQLAARKTKDSRSRDILVLSESEIRQCVDLDHEAIGAVEDAFGRMSAGQATVPPIMIIEVPENLGEVDVKSAYLSGLDSFAIKVASGFSGNSGLGLPNSSGLMIVVSARTGFPEAVLLDNGYLTDVRTAAAGAVAAKYLAREDVKTVGVIGVGIQARFQIRALQLVRRFDRLLVFGRNPTKIQRYVTEMKRELGVRVEAVPDVPTLVSKSDVVVTTTPSHEPLIKSAWMQPGLHITAMGSDVPHKQELDADVLVRADRLVCDSKSQCVRLGELHHALRVDALSPARIQDIVELGDLVLSRHPGRRTDQEITVCDLTGVGVQDTAIARLAYNKAVDKGLGLRVPS
jgi:ectoine utilization protein EutC